MQATSHFNLALYPRWQQWGVLLLLSAVFVSLFELAKIPAALMLGPMFASIIVSVLRSSILMPKTVFKSGQAIIGCMIASALTPAVISHFLENWWIFLSVIFATLFASSLLGYSLARMHIMPGSTAVWGTTPGAASTMVIMAEAFGADFRLVAFMQYLRVLMVVLAASAIAALAMPSMPSSAASAIEWFPRIIPQAFIPTILIALGGSLLANKLHFPAGNLLVPLVIGSILNGMGWVSFQLPEWLLAMSYAVIGWRIGLSFDTQTLLHAYRKLPVIIFSVLLLMGFCGCLAWILVLIFHIDPLTAYLATSPGGLDTIAIIVAARPSADMSLVITLQTARLLLLTILCPPIATFLAKRTHGHEQAAIK